jgi:hypothetical protein
MSGASSPRSVFTKRSGKQHAHDMVNDSPAFKRAKFWFWPIVLGVTIFSGFFAGIQGAFIGFFYGLVVGGFLLHESLQVKKREKR